MIIFILIFISILIIMIKILDDRINELEKSIEILKKEEKMKKREVKISLPIPEKEDINKIKENTKQIVKKARNKLADMLRVEEEK